MKRKSWIFLFWTQFLLTLSQAQASTPRNKPCVLLFGDVASKYQLPHITNHELDVSVPLESMRSDYIDARKVRDAILEKNDYLHAGALRMILEYAFENAAGHGALGSNSTVKYGVRNTEEGVDVYILNDRHRPLPEALRNKVLRSDGETFTVPNDQRDFKRGGFGIGVTQTSSALLQLYLGGLQTKSVATVSWREVQEPADKAHPDKVLYHLHIPRPTVAEKQNLAQARRNERNANRREEYFKKEFYKATDLLEKVGSGKFDGSQKEIDKARQRMIAVLEKTLEENKWQEYGFPAIFALESLGSGARDTEPLLWRLMERKTVGEETSPARDIANAIAAVSDFGPSTMQKIAAGLRGENEHFKWFAYLALACSTKDNKASLKPLMWRPLLENWEDSEYPVLQAMKDIPFDASDVPQVAKIFRNEMNKTKPELFYAVELAKKIGPHLESLRPLLLEALTKPTTSYDGGILLNEIGLRKEDLPAIARILSNPSIDQNQAYHTLSLVEKMGPDARPLVPQLLALLDSEHGSYGAAQALKKIGLNAEERAQISKKLDKAKLANDSYLIHRLDELLKP